ncbi:MAG: glycoside hydrolase family 3 protein [Sumerlaeia bacterium]
MNTTIQTRKRGGLVTVLCLLAGFSSASDSLFEFTIQNNQPGFVLKDQEKAPGVTPGIPLRAPDMTWVNNTLAAMTLDEKIGQLLMTAPGSGELTYINDYKIGGFIFLGNNQSAANIVSKVNSLQAASSIPLWFSIDSEAGLGARVSDATVFPMQMGFGAADDPSLMEQMGRVTARESQALGIQISFGPVVDVNTEEINPIISSRSLGDKPALVSRLAEGYITGARAEGILCTYKHFPGHGGTQGDSHSSLPGVSLSLADLRANHIKPYENLISTGNVDFVMTAHVWYSSVMGATPYPSTLSPIFNKDILRDEFGYQGLLISDAYNMAGLVIAEPDEKERAVAGIQAGLDIILHTGDISQFFIGIKEAVIDNEITEARIDESVLRILTAKSRAGLPERATVDPTLWPTVLQHPDHLSVVRNVCEQSLTQFRELPGGEQIDTSDDVILFELQPNRTIFYDFPITTFTTAMQSRFTNLTVVSVPQSPSGTSITGYLAQASGKDHVVVISRDFNRLTGTQQVNFVNQLTATATPVTYISLGSPYHLNQVPDVDAFYCGYTSVPDMQNVIAEALAGEIAVQGTPPVSLQLLGTTVNDYLIFR